MSIISGDATKLAFQPSSIRWKTFEHLPNFCDLTVGMFASIMNVTFLNKKIPVDSIRMQTSFEEFYSLKWMFGN